MVVNVGVVAVEFDVAGSGLRNLVCSSRLVLASRKVPVVSFLDD